MVPHAAKIRPTPKAWGRHSSIVETKDTLHDTVEVGRNMYLADPSAVDAAPVLVEAQLDIEGSAEGSHGATQIDGARCDVIADDGQTVCTREAPDPLDVR